MHKTLFVTCLVALFSGVVFAAAPTSKPSTQPATQPGIHPLFASLATMPKAIYPKKEDPANVKGLRDRWLKEHLDTKANYEFTGKVTLVAVSGDEYLVLVNCGPAMSFYGKLARLQIAAKIQMNIDTAASLAVGDPVKVTGNAYLVELSSDSADVGMKPATLQKTK